MGVSFISARFTGKISNFIQESNKIEFQKIEIRQNQSYSLIPVYFSNLYASTKKSFEGSNILQLVFQFMRFLHEIKTGKIASQQKCENE